MGCHLSRCFPVPAADVKNGLGSCELKFGYQIISPLCLDTGVSGIIVCIPVVISQFGHAWSPFGLS